LTWCKVWGIMGAMKKVKKPVKRKNSIKAANPQTKGGPLCGAKNKSREIPKKKPIKTNPAPKEQLTDKEDRLCREFLANGEIQVRAFMQVYRGYSYDNARTESSKVFAKPHIKSRIKELREERNKRLEITADKVLAELAKLSFYDPRDFFDSDGRLKPIDELDPDHAAIITGIETMHKTVGEEKDGLIVLTKIKLPDKGANLERLGRYFKLFTDKSEVGLDAQTAALIMAGLPEEYQSAIKRKIAEKKGK
jgi:phage terminase small subunit